jgi:hypothetical protein
MASEWTRRRFAQAGSATALWLLPALTAAARLFPGPGEAAFRVLGRDGELGRHSYRFAVSAGTFEAQVDSEIALPTGAGGQRSYSHHSREVWRDGWLDELVSDTKDGEARWRLRAQRSRGALRGERNGQGFSTSGYLITTALWHPDTPLMEALIDSVDGEVKPIRGFKQEDEDFAIAGQTVTATRYLIYGSLERVVWYDGERRLVRFIAPAPDGSPLVFARFR